MTLTVLHAIPSFVGGGAERQLSLLAPELCRLGVSNHVAYVHPGVHLERFRDTPVELHAVTCGGNHDPRILFKLIELIRTIRPDVVQTWLPQMDILAGLAALITGTPFVLTERSSSLAYVKSWKNSLRRLIGLRADVVVANSQGGLDYWGAAEGARYIIRNGLAMQLNHASEPASLAAFGLPNNARLVLFAGRLCAVKNIHTLLDALDLVLRRHPDAVALLFGDGSMHAELLTHIDALNTRDRVRLAGFTPDLWAWMRRASVFISVSHFEGNPNTVLEAMAQCCPLVVSSIPQHCEILDETLATFCDQTSPQDISRAIDYVFNEPNLAVERAVAAQNRTKAWSIENAADNYFNLYREIVSRRATMEIGK
jgi:glycosyltransferase involved in cell wall biosynthesis